MRAARRGRTLVSTVPPGATEHVDIGLSAFVNAAVLITGRTPGEREFCARMIHARGRNARGPFVTFRPPNGHWLWPDLPLVGDPSESRLSRCFAEARGGTFFLANVDTLPRSGQRCLEGLLDRTASLPPEAANLRVISASASLWRSCQSQQFSLSLFYRLNTIHIDLDRTTF